ncbi:MAG: tetratricopeptide repeat protein, partial [Acidobacteriota bacterium]
RSNLLLALLDAERLDEAESSARRALEISERVQGEGSDGWLRARRLLGNVWLRQNRLEESREMAVENMSRCRARHGEPEGRDPCSGHQRLLDRLAEAEAAG